MKSTEQLILRIPIPRLSLKGTDPLPLGPGVLKVLDASATSDFDDLRTGLLGDTPRKIYHAYFEVAGRDMSDARQVFNRLNLLMRLFRSTDLLCPLLFLEKVGEFLTRQGLRRARGPLYYRTWHGGGFPSDDTVRLDEGLEKSLQDLARLIFPDPPNSTSALEGTLSFFTLAPTRPLASGRVVDLVTALEGITVPEDEDPRCKRFSERLARILEPFDVQKKSRTQLKRFYDLRSRIVHGGTLDGFGLTGKGREGNAREWAQKFVIPLDNICRFTINFLYSQDTNLFERGARTRFMQDTWNP